MTKGIAVLGSTGSIGAQTLEVARFLGLRVHALAAGENVDLLFTQTREFLPEFVSVAFAPAADRLHARLNSDAGLLRALDGRTIEVGYGDAGLRKAAAGTDAETTVAAVSGAAGLPAVLAAIRAKKRVALANKESLVMAGRLVTSGAKERGVDLIPVDSEHCAIFQCLAGSARGDVRRLVLTASGGPFRDRPVAELAGITPEQAAAHPVWNMGKKISIDSATMMNKGLEVIEASWLFGVGREHIDVL
ncbi:MAG: 1-deoxy-D-xylulose-5-phosphate reductoisomerase, partial [Clostridiales bacterium]|nr:1-deoxy-D-xylulose-5-phosphate reductoisomerase [Clostridiales bacterium]